MTVSRRDFLKFTGGSAAVFSTASLVPSWIAKSAQAVQDNSGEDRILPAFPPGDGLDMDVLNSRL